MIKKYIYTLLVAVAFLAVGCREKAAKDNLNSVLVQYAQFKKVLPEIATPLKLFARIPSDSDIKRGGGFEFPRNIDFDTAGNIYICDVKADCVFKYNPAAHFVERMGRRGQGPGEFLTPNIVSTGLADIAISDSTNGRIQFLDFNGKDLAEFKTYKSLIAMHQDRAGKIISSPVSIDETEHPLIEVLNRNGVIECSFGRTGVYKWDSSLMNEVKIDINPRDSIYIAYRFVNKISIYSMKGVLENEIRPECAFLVQRESQNIKIAQKDLKKNVKRNYLPTLESIRAVDDGFYLLTNYHCPIILKCDLRGRIVKCYFYYKPCFASDFLVKTNEEGFYLLISYPEPYLDELVI